MGATDICLKILNGIFQTTFLIAGLGLAAYGGLSTYSIYLTNSKVVIETYGTTIPPIVITSFGLVLLILVLVGCCGIWMESPKCVESYAGLLLLLAMSQLAFGGYCVILYGRYGNNNMQNLSQQIDADITGAVLNYKRNPQWMDEIQTWMKCCGSKDPSHEYSAHENFPNIRELPATCCDRNINPCTEDDRYRDGCLETVTVFTYGTNYIIGWISIIIGATELVASLLGICLSCCIWRNQMGSWR